MSMRAEWETWKQDGNKRTSRHSIEIIDTGGSINGTFDIDFEQGFVLTDGGKPKDRWPTIQPRSLRFSMKVLYENHYRLAKAIGTSTKITRFIVIYKRSGRVNFVGLILTEGTTLTEGAKHKVDGLLIRDGVFTITAVDGITLLQGETIFLSGDNVPRTFRSWFREIFRNMPTLSYLASRPFRFQTSWVPDTGSENFMENQAVASGAFLKGQLRQGGQEPLTKWDMLVMFCETFNMRCFSSNGYYIFQQLENLDGVMYVYDQVFNPQGTTAPQFLFSQTVGDNATGTGLEMRAPEVTSWVPPIRGARVVYKADFNPNLLLGEKYDLSVATSECKEDVSTVPVKTGLERLRIIASLEYTLVQGSYAGQVRVVFNFVIKVGANYYVREVLPTGNWRHPQYQTPEWTTTPGFYQEYVEFLNVLPGEDLLKFYIPIFFSTARLDIGWDDDPFTMCLSWIAYGFDDVDPQGYQLLTKQELDMQVFLDDLDVAVLDVENNLVEPVERIVELENEVENQEIIERTIYFSSGPNAGSISRITDDSRPPISTLEWTAPGLGTGLHYNILAKSLASRGAKASTFMHTTVEGPYNDLFQLRACGATWIWWSGQYEIKQHQEFHSGEFLQLNIDPVTDEPFEIDNYSIVERPTVPTKGIGGPGNTIEIEVTGITGDRINADTYKIPMPDTTGWPADAVRDAVQYNLSGNPQRYREVPTITNEFGWDNDNRDFVLSENSQARLWHIFRIFF